MDASPDPAVRPTRHPAVPASALVARRAVPVVLALGLAVLALWQNVTHAPQTSFNQDESRWLHRAHYLREVLDPFGSTWDDRYLTRGQPPLGSYLMGAGLLLQGRDLATNGSWVYTCQEGRCRPAFAKWEENVAAGNLPSPADLTAGRRANAAIGALTVVVVFLLGRRLTNDVGGVAGAALLAIHPFQIYIASLATADALLGLLIALTALAAARFAERPRWPRAIVLGLLLGLGGATKLSPLLTALLLAGWGIAILGGERWRTPARAASARPRTGWRLA